MANLENWEIKKIEENKNKNKKIAVVGGGPSGLTASAYLARRGYEVTIYEKHQSLGGLLVHGIPDFRLPREKTKQTIQKILDLGVKVKFGQEIGKNITLKEIKEQNDAVLLSFGANISSKMNIEGENLEGVYGGNELLEYEKYPDFTGKTVAVIGGGNTAMDASRTIKRKNAKKVMIIYRRSRSEMPAENEETESAIQEGIEILYQTNITKIIGKEKVEKAKCIKTELIKTEGERPRPVNVEGTDFLLDVDYVIMALGAKPEKEILEKLGLETTEKGYIKVDENGETSEKNVFASGELIGSKGTVAWAARSGRDIAEKICEKLQ